MEKIKNLHEMDDVQFTANHTLNEYVDNGTIHFSRGFDFMALLGAEFIRVEEDD